jgi:hypothetical protein
LLVLVAITSTGGFVTLAVVASVSTVTKTPSAGNFLAIFFARLLASLRISFSIPLDNGASLPATAVSSVIRLNLIFYGQF